MLEAFFLSVAAVALATLLFTTAANAKNNPGYTHVGQNITIEANQQVSDVTCVACSIYIRGQVSGDATPVGGSIFVEDQGQVAGEVTTVAGNLRLGQTVTVGGDATVVGGEIRRDPGAEIGGDVTHVGGFAWMWLLLIVALPLAALCGIVMLIVWMVRRFTMHRVPATA